MWGMWAGGLWTPGIKAAGKMGNSTTCNLKIHSPSDVFLHVHVHIWRVPFLHSVSCINKNWLSWRVLFNYNPFHLRILSCRAFFSFIGAKISHILSQEDEEKSVKITSKHNKMSKALIHLHIQSCRLWLLGKMIKVTEKRRNLLSVSHRYRFLLI